MPFEVRYASTSFFHLLYFLKLSCRYWQEYRVNSVTVSEVTYYVLPRRQKAEQLHFTYSNYYADFHRKKTGCHIPCFYDNTCGREIMSHFQSAR